MNITEFKSLVEPANKAEETRLNNLTSRHFKHLSNGIGVKEVNTENASKVWHSLNNKLAAEDKFHRQQTHEMRNYKGGFEDYSDMAYNNSADDL